VRPKAFVDAVTMQALHGASRLALRFLSPLAARRAIVKLAACLPPFEDLSQARAAGQMLTRGTCLSRSLAISARLSGSHVVIGVDVRRSSRLLAHAWVQLGGEVVYPTQPIVHSETLASF
jgi:Transglutaminase-like superfamily